MIIQPRGWQIDALAKLEGIVGNHFLLDATPGSGKTLFAAFAAKYRFERGDQFALIVVPTTPIKGGPKAGFLGDWHKVGIEIKTNLDDARDPPKDYRGAVVTYHKLPNLIGTIEVWVRNGLNLFSVFDEVHHTSKNKWGLAAERLARSSKFILSMTGTCFRGDGRPISFVNYDVDKKAIADHRYGYRQAVAERVCRKVDFLTDDSMTEFMLGKNNHNVWVSEAKTAEQLRGATGTVFRTDHEYLAAVIGEADKELEQYRTWDPNAGGLIICRAGRDKDEDEDEDENEDEGENERYLHQVADLAKTVTGKIPVVISYDDPDANVKIDKFRDSEEKWICAVRKISEGVDIKRLRVLIMATRPTSELLFRQIVGRVVRVDDDKNPGSATIYIAKFKQLEEWAKTISEEAKAGLVDRKTRDGGDGGGGDGEPRYFVPLAASHEQGGAVSDYGDQFTADQVNAAERFRENDPRLADMAITQLAYIQRKMGVAPEPNAPAEPPKEVKKKEVRRIIVNLARALAIKRNKSLAVPASKPDFKQVWTDIGDRFGPYNAEDLENNHTVDSMRQMEAWLRIANAR